MIDALEVPSRNGRYLFQRGPAATVSAAAHTAQLGRPPGGRIAFVLQAPGNRHDVRGLYGLRKTTFRGHLVGDNAYWPKGSKREALARRGITVTAATRSNWKVQHTAEEQAMLKQWRGKVERRIGLFDRQFHAGRTLCRSHRHYEARRWFKVLSHNLSRHLNRKRRRPAESVAHFRLAA